MKHVTRGELEKALREGAAQPATAVNQYRHPRAYVVGDFFVPSIFGFVFIALLIGGGCWAAHHVPARIAPVPTSEITTTKDAAP
jgi:hypothetical protein